MTPGLFDVLATAEPYMMQVTTAQVVRAWVVVGLVISLIIAYIIIRASVGRIRARRFVAPFAIAGALLLVIGGMAEYSLKELTSVFFRGLTEGGLYALIAVGYTMVYGVVKLINFAHGEIFMLAGFMVFAFMSETAFGPALGMTILAVIVLYGATWVTMGEKKPMGMKAGVSAGISIPLAFGIFLLFRFAQLPFAVSLILAIILSACLGMTCDLVAYKPLRSAPRLSALLTAIGLSIAFQNIALVIWGGKPFRLPISKGILDTPALPPGGSADISWTEMFTQYYRMRILGAEITLLELVTITVSLTAMGVLWYIVARTKVGKAMRATSMDKPTAALMGISVNRTIASTFFIGSSFAAVGAAFYCLVLPSALSFFVGYQVGIIAFAAAVLGGIGSIPGACIGGYLIGFAMAFAPWLNVPMFLTALGMGRLIPYLPELSLTAWAYGFAYIIMIFIIIFRPSGILGKEEAAARA
ncbi:MAG: branched-chain amino acid ABC transporter permease [Planctomycetota bacterium]|jgi:branched-chain amino acid transport system permease protein